MIRLVTDSTCDMTQDQADQLGISAIARLYVIFGKKTFQDGVSINNEQFYARLKTDPNFPTTSQPSVGDFTHIYEQFKGDQIVSIHVSRDLSGTITSAEAAAKMVGGDITIIDSRNVNAGLSLLLARASYLIQQGANIAEIKANIQKAVMDTRLFFALETLENLKRGGRIGGAQALLGGMLQFKPIIAIKEGRVEPVERVRTMAKAVARLKEIAVSDLQDKTAPDIAFMHVGAPESVRELKSNCGRELKLQGDPMVLEVGPVVGTHTGSGAIGVSYIL
jgi:DegV family protein with EDD domain